MRNRNMRESTTTTASATVNYDLPQWNGEDVTSWMTNLNDAFNKIDSAMWANHTAMAGYDKIASDLQKLADGIKVDNAEIREALRIVQQGMADQLTQLNQAKTDITNANLAISQLQTEDNALSAMIEDLQDDVGMLGDRSTYKFVEVSGNNAVNGIRLNGFVHNGSTLIMSFSIYNGATAGTTTIPVPDSINRIISDITGVSIEDVRNGNYRKYEPDKKDWHVRVTGGALYETEGARVFIETVDNVNSIVFKLANPNNTGTTQYTDSITVFPKYYYHQTGVR